MFNTPLVSLLVALGLIALHIPTMFMTYEDKVPLLYDYALVPQRFFAPAGSDLAYSSAFAKWLTLVTTALLHGDILHVGVNALMTWQFGSLVARVLGPGIAAAGLWMLMFVVSVIAGSLTYLVIIGPLGPVAIGASGGTSGLIAAGFLVTPEGRIGSPLSRQFLVMSAVFAAINVVLVLLGPAVLGMGISWEAHLGGYVAGMVMMLILGRKMRVRERA